MTFLNKVKKRHIGIMIFSILLILLPNYWNIYNYTINGNNKENGLMEDNSIDSYNNTKISLEGEYIVFENQDIIFKLLIEDLIYLKNFILNYVENDPSIKPSQGPELIAMEFTPIFIIVIPILILGFLIIGQSIPALILIIPILLFLFLGLNFAF